MLTLLPAIDVSDGKAVRLLKGEAGSESDYGSPVDAARDWVEAGAEWIHLVDLDAAFGRGPTLRCWPASWARSASRSNYLEESATMPRCGAL